MTNHCAVFTHPVALEHDTGAGHPENKSRIEAILKALDAAPIEGAVIHQAQAAPIKSVLACHSERYLEKIKKTIPETGTANLDEDTVISAQSFQAALTSAGGGVNAVDTVLDGHYKRAFSIMRPPGHHALYDGSCGFCVLGNAAIAAKHAIETRGLSRVAIVDFDVHHGNGTQDILKQGGRETSSDNIFIASLHEKELWPYNSNENEICTDTMLNIPVPRDSDPKFYHDAFKHKAIPALDKFAPELIIIAAGFDAHRDDPPKDALFNDPPGKQNLLEEDFEWMTRALVRLAEKHGQGRVVSVLEGGYNVDVLARCVISHIKTLITT